MGHASHDPTLPRGALIGAAVLLSIAIAGAWISRTLGYSATPAPPASVVESRDLLFSDGPDGSVRVTDPQGVEVAVVKPGTNGFLRGVMRGLAQERLRRHEGTAIPFRLTHWSDGRLSLTDPVTNRHVYLEAFGPTNAAAFAALLSPPARPN